MSIIKKIFQPLFEDEYNRGFTAGVNAEKLVKEKDWEQREYDLLCRGAELERKKILAELETEIEEISAKEFEELINMNKEPFGFTGTMDNMQLVGVEE